MLLTPFEILFNSDPAPQLGAVERVRPGSFLGHGLDSLPVRQMRGLYTKPLDKYMRLSSKTRIAEGNHGVGEVPGSIESSRADVDVDHQLLIRRTNGRVEALPSFESATQRHGGR